MLGVYKKWLDVSTKKGGWVEGNIPLTQLFFCCVVVPLSRQLLLSYRGNSLFTRAWIFVSKPQLKLGMHFLDAQPDNHSYHLSPNPRPS